MYLRFSTNFLPNYLFRTFFFSLKEHRIQQFHIFGQYKTVFCTSFDIFKKRKMFLAVYSLQNETKNENCVSLCGIQNRDILHYTN